MTHLRMLKCVLCILVFFTNGMALAQLAGKTALEARLHEKLSRILTEDEYLLDIKITPDASTTASNDKYLPGLQVLGAVSEESGTGPLPIVLGGKADILLKNAPRSPKISSIESLILKD